MSEEASLKDPNEQGEKSVGNEARRRAKGSNLSKVKSFR